MNKRKLKKYAKKKGLPIPLILSIKEKKNKMNKGGLSSGQAKLAAKAPPRNKIDGKDFAVLRAEKAKGRGMGLQDESVKPGKVMKANLGLMFNKKAGGVMKYKRGMGPGGLDLPVISSVKPAVHKTKRAQNLSKMKIQFNKQRSRMGDFAKKKGLPKPLNPNMAKGFFKTVGVFPKVSGPFSSMAEMRKAKGFKPGESATDFNKRRKMLAGVTKAASATKIGKIALGIGAAGVAAQQYLKSKMKKKDEPKKKMGGGMMQKPMGYKIGTGEKPLETAMNKKRAEQTKNVKRLTTQSDAYDPEIRFLHASKKTRSGSSNVLRRTTDQVNLKEARNKFKEELPRGFNVRIKTSEEMRPRRAIGKYSKGTMVKARGCKLGRTRPTKIT